MDSTAGSQGAHLCMGHFCPELAQYILACDALLAIPYVIAITLYFFNGRNQRSVVPDLLFWFSTAVALFCLRAPFIFLNAPSAVDETVFLVRAKMALHNPIPWTGYDTTTSGPIDSLTLLILSLLHLPVDYFSARCIAALIVLASLFVFSKIIERSYGVKYARMSTLFPLAFFAQAEFLPFLAYTSELMPVLLIVMCVDRVTAYMRSPKKNTIIQCGLMLGAIPFAKLQAAPICLFLCVYVLFTFMKNSDEKNRLHLLWFFSSILCVPILVLAPVYASSGFNDFVISYLLEPSQYVSKTHPVRFVLKTFETQLYAQGALYTLGFCVLRYCSWKFKKGNDILRSFPASALKLYIMLFFVSLSVVLSPGKGYPHYILFLILPLSLVVSESVFLLLYDRGVESPLHENQFASKNKLLFTGLLVLQCMPFFMLRIGNVHNYTMFLHENEEAMSSSDMRLLSKFVEPGKSMMVWGFMPDIYLWTKSTVAAHDAMTQFEISDGKYRTYYRDRFLYDLKKNKPTYIVDAVFKGANVFQDRSTLGIESVPEIANEVNRYYRVIGSNGRIYIFARM